MKPQQADNIDSTHRAGSAADRAGGGRLRRSAAAVVAGAALSVLVAAPAFANETLNDLMGLTRLDWADSSSQLGWRWPLPAWAWVLVVLCAGFFAWWSYSRLMGSRMSRWSLAAVRSLIILFIVVLLAGPMLVLPQEQVEPDWLVVMVDRSASMQIEDVPEGAMRISRDYSLRRAMSFRAEAFSEEALGKDRRVLWLGFDAGSYEIQNPLIGRMPDAEGQSTAIRSAIDQALQRVAGRPVSGLVLISDGRSSQATGPELVRRLQQQAISVFPVPVGAEKTPLDLAVGRVDAPDKAFVNDSVPVRVWVDRYPLDAEIDPTRVSVRLVDRATGRVLDEQRLSDEDDLAEPVRLTAREEAAGPATWEVELTYDAPADPAQRELITDNNMQTLSVELIDRPLRVLYVEGYPRWEYRYLKNMLLREKSIQSSVLLLSADPQFVQEGDVPLARLPRTPDELSEFDVIMIGDVPASYFTDDQLRLYRDHVSVRGAGLLWIGGPYQTPVSYVGTPLAELLPMMEPSGVSPLGDSLMPVTIRPTREARNLSVLELESPGEPDGDGAQDNWPADLPGFFWVQNMGRLKPAAEILAVTQNRPDSAEQYPALARLRYGGGETIYLATDETWRWRFGRGDLYYDQFWTQLIQKLGRSRVQSSQSGAFFEVSHRRIELDQPVVLTVRIDDPLLLQRNLPNLQVQVLQADAAQERTLETLELQPVSGDNGDRGLASEQSSIRSREYRAIWRPTISGRLLLRVSEPALADRNLAQGIEVIRPDDELRQPATDHPRLAALAEATGGQVVPLDDMEQLPSLLPNRARRTPLDIREPLWDSPLALIIALTLFTAEWIGRKATRLV